MIDRITLSLRSRASHALLQLIMQFGSDSQSGSFGFLMGDSLPPLSYGELESPSLSEGSWRLVERRPVEGQPMERQAIIQKGKERGKGKKSRFLQALYSFKKMCEKSCLPSEIQGAIIQLLNKPNQRTIPKIWCILAVSGCLIRFLKAFQAQEWPLWVQNEMERIKNSLSQNSPEEAYEESWGDIYREEEYKRGLKEVKRFYRNLKYPQD